MGIIVKLLPILFIVQLFQRLRSRQQSLSPLQQILFKIKQQPIITINVDSKEEQTIEINLSLVVYFLWLWSFFFIN
jgi:hypothetical protein